MKLAVHRIVVSDILVAHQMELRYLVGHNDLSGRMGRKISHFVVLGNGPSKQCVNSVKLEITGC